MEHQSLVLGRDATTGTDDTEHIKTMIRRMFRRSHHAICIPLHDRELDNPLTREEQVILKIAARRDIQNLDIQYLTNVIEALVEDFMDVHVTRKLDTAQNYESFFQYCISLDNYFDHVTGWIDTMLAPLEQEEGSPFTGSFMADNAFERIVTTYTMKLKLFFLDKASNVRTWHSYLSDWAFDAAYNARFLKMIKRLISYNKGVDGSNEWEESYVHLVKEEVRRKLNMLANQADLREFLANTTAAWNQEWKLYSKIFDSPAYTKQEFKEIILQPAYTNYVHRRSISHHTYFSVVDLMTADNSNYDPRLLSDLFLILTYKDQCFTDVVDQLRTALSAYARKKFYKGVEEIFCDDIDHPDWDFGRIMVTFRRAGVSYNRRWRNALRQTLREDQLDYMKSALTERVFKFIKSRTAAENIEKISESCTEYLCGIEGPRQTHMKLGTVIQFFRTVANQDSFWRYATKNVLRRIVVGRADLLHLMSEFCGHPGIPKIPDELYGLLFWIEEANKVSEQINNDENEERIVQNANATLKVSGTVFAEKYMSQYEPNLLRKPEELVDIDKRFAAVAHQECDLKEEQRLRVQNGRSVLRIRTNIFGTKKELIALILTVYQYSVLFCLSRMRKMTVKELCSTLKRTDVTERTDLKRVRRVVKLVLMSLLQRYQLIKILSRQPTEEIRPSRPEDISLSHYIVLNKELQTERESLELPRPDLRLSTVDEVEDEIENEDVEQAVTADPFRARTARHALFHRCRAKCATSANNLINEEETISEVHDRLRRFGMEMRSIRFAAEILIREGKIERYLEGGISMLKCNDPGALE